jgi:hypothetical protein
MKHNRLFAACGIVSVALELGGTFVSFGSGKTHDLTISSTPAQVGSTLAKQVGVGVWVGAYMELLSFGLFLAFACWMTARLGGGLLGSIARSAATSYAAVSTVSLGFLGALAYGAGRGLDPGTGRALVIVNESIFVGTWFLMVVFLVPAALLALAQGRRNLGWSGLAIGAYTLVATPASLNGFGQFSTMLFLIWVIAASIALSRGERSLATADVPVTA